tara:strand:- start:278 stop:502 length:225 start_codon:yes stop_codon:yes gene_type:complete
MKKYINGELVNLTNKEVEQRNSDLQKAQTEKEQIKIKEEQKKIDAKNGNQKLLNMGLTQAEATALIGYKPPEEE